MTWLCHKGIFVTKHFSFHVLFFFFQSHNFIHPHTSETLQVISQIISSQAEKEDGISTHITYAIVTNYKTITFF